MRFILMFKTKKTGNFNLMTIIEILCIIEISPFFYNFYRSCDSFYIKKYKYNLEHAINNLFESLKISKKGNN